MGFAIGIYEGVYDFAASLGSGVPYWNTFFLDLFLKGTIIK